MLSLHLVIVAVLGCTAGAPVSEDVLSGREFLAMYMRRQSHYLDHNAIPHKEEHYFNDIGNEVRETTTQQQEETTTELVGTSLLETTQFEQSTTESDWGTELPSRVVVRVSSSVVRNRAEPIEKSVTAIPQQDSEADSFPSASQTLEKIVQPENVINKTESNQPKALAYQSLGFGARTQKNPLGYEARVIPGRGVSFYQEPQPYDFQTENRRNERNFKQSEQTLFTPYENNEKPDKLETNENYFGKKEQGYRKNEFNYNKPDIIQNDQPFNTNDYSKAIKQYESATAKQEPQNFAKTNIPYNIPEQVYGKPEQVYAEPEKVYSEPEQNYEVDEAVSVSTNGQAHGVQDGKDKHKFGYVVEGRNYRKYRVEERTSDGFIVGEYGVVSHDDGSLRGVRYTADSTINPRLIYDALLKFLSLK